MGEFTFKHAVMTAGKSRDLARVHYTYRQKGEQVVVFVPSTDTRSGSGFVRARSGEEISAYSVVPGELKKTFLMYLEGLEKISPDSDLSCILMDEVQFFTREDIFAIKELACINRGIPVIAYGLKSDFRNEMFTGAAAAMIVAENIQEIETICAFCNDKAIMNMRFENGSPVKDGKQIQIGDEEYRPVCHYHYNSSSTKIEAENDLEISQSFSTPND